MDFSIASILVLDGATNGAIYALMALATVFALSHFVSRKAATGASAAK